MGKLEGKVAIVSGSGRGIGRACALKLAREGARVLVNDLDAEPAAEVVAAIKSADGEAIAVAGSVTRMTQATEAAGTTVNVGGRDVPAGIPAQQVRLMEAGIPLGRGGTPEEAANSIYLLCTPEANYISGHVLMVTGGL